MRLLIFALLAIGAIAEEDFSLPEYASVDATLIVPVEDLPGFWEGRELPSKIFKPSPRTGRNTRCLEAVPHSHPYQVATHISFGIGIGLCGGSVLGTNAVLTAAHCPIGSTSTLVIAGAHNRNIAEPNQQRRTVPPENYRIHPDYNQSNLNNNVAILIIPTPWIPNDFVQPTRLPTDFANELFVGETATVSGWGRDTDTGLTSSVVRESFYTVISNAECITFNESVICISSYGECCGDAGGTLTVPRDGDARPVQIGIKSFISATACAAGFPFAYTRVTRFLTWINSNQ